MCWFEFETNFNQKTLDVQVFTKFVHISYSSEPSPPYGVKVFQRSMDSLTVDWKMPIHPNGKITGYDVHIRPPAPGVTFPVPSPELSVTISNKPSHRIFKSGVQYTFWVKI